MTTRAGLGAPVSRRRLWFGVAIPPVVWAVHGLFSVLLVVLACRHGPSTVSRIIGDVATGGALAASVFAGLVAYGSWHRLGRPVRVLFAEGNRQDEMLATVGVLGSFFFTLGILWDGLPIFVLRDLCENLR